MAIKYLCLNSPFRLNGRSTIEKRGSFLSRRMRLNSPFRLNGRSTGTMALISPNKTCYVSIPLSDLTEGQREISRLIFQRFECLNSPFRLNGRSTLQTPFKILRSSFCLNSPFRLNGRSTRRSITKFHCDLGLLSQFPFPT